MNPLIQVNSLKKYFTITKGLIRKEKRYIRAVDGVSFEIYPGETFGLVGESGSGKSTIARLLLRLIEPTDGGILFEGKDITKIHGKELRSVRRKMGIVFQDPASSLNPRSTIRGMLMRPLQLHGVPKEEAETLIAETLEKVNLGSELLDRYPHQLSGGQQQR
ncbi:oligopeptide ABC transporter ATP-binding protein, partial [Thermococci archaeon]